MISLVTKAATEAKNASSKRVLAVHLKQAIMKDDQFDFLMEKVNKIPDAPVNAEKSDEPDEANEAKRRRGPGRKKRRDSDE